ncbi:MAG: hypothetical protein HPY74_17385 [Firmicutes bacterium]|nr:hypothetical protein [Bacillota bacterium]
MKKIILIILALIVFFAMATGAGYNDKTIKVDGLKIQGPKQFREDIVEGLDLLRDKAPEYYDMVVENVKKVYYSEENFNGINQNRVFSFTKVAYEIRKAQGMDKVYYIALDLAHEGYHGWRMKEVKMTLNDEKEEWLAVQTEKEVAKLIDAPQEIKDWLEEKFDTRYWEKQGN